MYAGCLSPATIRELEGLGHATLVPVLMDITRDKDVQAVMDRIKEEEGGLYALVNNAGRGKRGRGEGEGKEEGGRGKRGRGRRQDVVGADSLFLYLCVVCTGIAYASLIDWTPVERYRR